MCPAPYLNLLFIGAMLVALTSLSASPVYIARSDINLHLHQSGDSKIILEIPSGAKVKVIDSSSGSWWQVRYQERQGFAKSDQLRYSEENDQLEYDPIVNASNLYKSKPSLSLPTQLALYEHPSTASAVITRLPARTEVKVIEEKVAAWTMVHVLGRTGYLQKASLNARPTEPVAGTAAPKPVTAVTSGATTANGTHTLTAATSLRQEADGKAKVLLRFEPGDQVEVIDDSGEWWWQANFKGKTGWVKRRLLQKN